MIRCFKNKNGFSEINHRAVSFIEVDDSNPLHFRRVFKDGSDETNNPISLSECLKYVKIGVWVELDWCPTNYPMYVTNANGFGDGTAFITVDSPERITATIKDGTVNPLNKIKLSNIIQYVCRGDWKVITHKEAQSLIKTIPTEKVQAEKVQGYIWIDGVQYLVKTVIERVK